MCVCSSVLFKAMAGLAEANQEAGLPPREAFMKAFAQVVVATDEELELLSREAGELHP